MFQSTRMILPMMLAGVFTILAVPQSQAGLVFAQKSVAGTSDTSVPKIRLAQRPQRGAVVRREERRQSSPNASRSSRGGSRVYAPRVRSKVTRTSPRVNRRAVNQRRSVVKKRRNIKPRRQIKRPRNVKRRNKHFRSKNNKRRPRVYRNYKLYDDYSVYYAKLSCAEVKSVLRSDGYRRLRAFDCRGVEYGFKARLGKRRYVLTVDAYTGNVIDRHRD